MTRAPKPAAVPAQLEVVDSCGTCRFWNRFAALPAMGGCYRFPPQMLPGCGAGGVRPALSAETAGCGEHRERPA